jgi:dihydroxyacetone synthase
MRSCGWNVLDVYNGTSDIVGITEALISARTSDKPTFINIRTVIGVGSAVAGDAKAHGAAFGPNNVASLKVSFGMDPNKNFFVPEEVYDYFRDVSFRGIEYENKWNSMVDLYSREYISLGSEFKKRMRGEMTEDWAKYIPSKGSFPTGPTASRKSAGLVCNPLAQNLNSFMVGTADLTPSVNMSWKDMKDFQHPDLRTACGINGDYSGRYIHWGIREHAMASISNGLAAFNKGTIIPITSTFFMFYIVSFSAYIDFFENTYLLLVCCRWGSHGCTSGATSHSRCYPRLNRYR